MFHFFYSFIDTFYYLLDTINVSCSSNHIIHMLTAIATISAALSNVSRFANKSL